MKDRQTDRDRAEKWLMEIFSLVTGANSSDYSDSCQEGNKLNSPRKSLLFMGNVLAGLIENGGRRSRS